MAAPAIAATAATPDVIPDSPSAKGKRPASSSPDELQAAIRAEGAPEFQVPRLKRAKRTGNTTLSTTNTTAPSTTSPPPPPPTVALQSTVTLPHITVHQPAVVEPIDAHQPVIIPDVAALSAPKSDEPMDVDAPSLMPDAEATQQPPRPATVTPVNSVVEPHNKSQSSRARDLISGEWPRKNMFDVATLSVHVTDSFRITGNKNPFAYEPDGSLDEDWLLPMLGAMTSHVVAEDIPIALVWRYCNEYLPQGVVYVPMSNHVLETSLTKPRNCVRGMPVQPYYTDRGEYVVLGNKAGRVLPLERSYDSIAVVRPSMCHSVGVTPIVPDPPVFAIKDMTRGSVDVSYLRKRDRAFAAAWWRTYCTWNTSTDAMQPMHIIMSHNGRHYTLLTTTNGVHYYHHNSAPVPDTATFKNVYNDTVDAWMDRARNVCEDILVHDAEFRAELRASMPDTRFNDYLLDERQNELRELLRGVAFVVKYHLDRDPQPRRPTVDHLSLRQSRDSQDCLLHCVERIALMIHTGHTNLACTSSADVAVRAKLIQRLRKLCMMWYHKFALM